MRPAIRARFDGNTPASRQAPSPPSRTSPTTIIVRPRPMWNSPTDAGDRRAPPIRSGWRPSRRSRTGSTPTCSRPAAVVGSSGNGRNSPTDGTPVSMIRAAADDDRDDTTNQASERAERALPPASDVVLDADERLGLACPQVRREPRAAPDLQAEHLGVSDTAASWRSRARRASSDRTSAASARRAPAATPRPHRTGR